MPVYILLANYAVLLNKSICCENVSEKQRNNK